MRPIPILTGSHDFNEVVLEDVFVPAGRLLGEPGGGWRQVTSELAYERSGPERFLSTFPLLVALVGELAAGDTDPTAAADVGALVTRLWTLRQMSVSVAAALEAGEAPALAAALVKDVGTRFESTIAEAARQLCAKPRHGRGLLAAAGGCRAAFSGLHPARRHERGVARHRGTRAGAAMTADVRASVREVAASIFAAADMNGDGFDATSWDRLEAAGFTLLTVPRDAGGSGADLDLAAAVLFEAGAARAARVPLAETDLARLAARRGRAIPLPAGPLAAVEHDADISRSGDGWRIRAER